jgi:hypothetical protein
MLPLPILFHKGASAPFPHRCQCLAFLEAHTNCRQMEVRSTRQQAQALHPSHCGPLRKVMCLRKYFRCRRSKVNT